METYNEFLTRINSFQNSVLDLGTGNFEVNPSLQNKVSQSNTFSSFYGDTVVFDLKNNEKIVVSDYIDRLYRTVPECFCERLVPDTLHMTLHDLSNSPILKDIAEDLFNNEIKLLKNLNAESIGKQTITMQSTCVFNMVNTSLVLGLKPVNEEEHIKLIKLYNYVDSIRILPYPLTPHITLAYFNRNGFDSDAKRNLERIVNEINKNKMIIELNTERLLYQKFLSMNEYISVFNLQK